MSDAPDNAATLEDWLRYIGSVHPRTIELGLDRSRQVLRRLALGRLAPTVITVAGTNGKGSCVAGIEFVLRQQGLRTGAYTSPHLQVFNERVRLNGENASDAALIAALAAVDAQRQDITLSYFEYATLAAFVLFAEAELDAVVLEVGLGGRLDAVNLIDADLAVITSISIDHVDWLGDDREGIGFEKAGIARTGCPLVCADRDLPQSIRQHAEDIAAPLYAIGEAFDLQRSAEAGQWQWSGIDRQGDDATVTAIPDGNFHPENLAAILQALCLLQRLPARALLARLVALPVPARFERRLDPDTGRNILLDVAHNAGGAVRLAERLRDLRAQNQEIGQIAVVLAVMADKDLESMTMALQSAVDIWYIAQVEEERCMPAREAAQRVQKLVKNAEIQHFPSVTEAYSMALQRSQPDDLIVVTGSFYTVAAIRDTSVPIVIKPE